MKNYLKFMKRTFLFQYVFWLIVLFSFKACGADSEVQDLTDITAPTLGDDMYIVDDPDATPASKKINIGALLGVANDLDTSGDVADDSHAHTASTLTEGDTLDSVAGRGQTTKVIAVGGLGTSGTVSATTVTGHTVTASYFYADRSIGSAGAVTATSVTGTTVSDGTFAVTSGFISGATNTSWDAGYTHVSADGSDHTFLDQSVISGATPTFGATNFSDGGSNAIVTTTQETNWDAHLTNDGSDHGYIDQSVIISSSPTFDAVNITGYAETDTLDAVCDRGDFTDQVLEVGGIFASIVSGTTVSGHTVIGSMIYSDNSVGGADRVTGNTVSGNNVTGVTVYFGNLGLPLPLGNPADNNVIKWDSTLGGWQLEADAGASGGTGFINLPIQSTKLTGNSVTLIDAGNPQWQLLMPDSGTGGDVPASLINNFAVWQFRMPASYASGLITKIGYSMVTESSVTVELEAYLWTISDGDSASCEVESYDTVNLGTETTPATHEYLTELSITMTNDDSVAAGDLCVLRLGRDSDDGSNDNAGGTVVIRHVELEFTE